MEPVPAPATRTALLAGAVAGMAVDLGLYPLDTLKTRQQSRAGLAASGGLRGPYRGVASAFAGSAPSAALFFYTYERAKQVLGAGTGAGGWARLALAAAVAEVASCAVRVPTEVIKQRAQAGQHGGSSGRALRAVLRGVPDARAAVRALYRGGGITILREVPFTAIEIPLWEAMKTWGRARREPLPGRAESEDVGALESAGYGAVAGAVAAAATTPLDVLKTRVMLSHHPVRAHVVLRDLLRDEGARALFSGLGPRVVWISLGGAIFLGSYTWCVSLLGA